MTLFNTSAHRPSRPFRRTQTLSHWIGEKPDEKRRLCKSRRTALGVLSVLLFASASSSYLAASYNASIDLAPLK